MEAGNNCFNLAVFKGRVGGRAFVDSLLVVVNNTRKLYGILCKDIFQASPARKYNVTHIESSKSKGGRSVKSCLQHTISVFFASCKSGYPVELEVIIDMEIFQKPSPKDTFSTMIDDSTLKRTILTSKFTVCDIEEFQNAYTIAQNKEYFVKTRATESSYKPLIYDHIEAIVVDFMTPYKHGFIDTNLGKRYNAYKDLRDAVDSFKFGRVHWTKLTNYNIILFNTSILVIIKSAITAKVKSTTRVHIMK